MADLAAPKVFENRSTYRLLDADLSGPRGRLVFGRGTYFNSIDLVRPPPMSTPLPSWLAAPRPCVLRTTLR